MPNPSRNDPERKRAAQAAAQAAREAEAHFLRAEYAAAEALYLEALAIYEARLRPDDLELARARLGLGQVRNAQGRFDEARALIETALPVLFRDPPSAGSAFYTLGEVIANQGDLSGGAAYIQQSYEMRRAALGPGHPDTLDSMSMLALFLFVQGETGDARRMIGFAVWSADQYQGPPSAAIGRVYHRQGRMLLDEADSYETARRAMERALEIYAQSEGPDHPDNGLTLNNLATLFTNRHAWRSARPLLERSLAIHERTFGLHSPYSMFVLNNLCEVEKNLGNLDSAYRCAAHALIAAVRGFGATSQQAVSALRSLVTIQVDRSHAGDAQAMDAAIPYNQVLATLEIAGRPGLDSQREKAVQRLEQLLERLEAELNRPPLSAEQRAALESARVLAALGNAAAEQGQHEEALERYRQALSTQESALGLHHLDHLPLLEKLIQASEAAGKPTAVLPLRERSVAILTAVLGEDHPQTLLALTSLYQQTLYEYGSETARPLLERIQAIHENSLMPENQAAGLLRGITNLLEGFAGAGKAGTARPSRSRSERIETALNSAADDPGGVLAGLSAIDWHSLQHAYGSADDTPRHLRLLLSSDEMVRGEAWEQLTGSIWHQGSLYPATAAVVPFLIRMIDHDGPPGRVEAFDFLAALASSSADMALRESPSGMMIDWDVMRARMGGPSGDEEAGGLSREEIEDSARVNWAAGEGVQRYLALLDDPDREIRLLALYMLSSLRGRKHTIRPALMERIDRFADAQERAAALYALRFQLDYTPEAIDFFQRWLSAPGGDAWVRYHAALGVLERAGAVTAPEVLDALVSVWPTVQRLEATADQPDTSAMAIFSTGSYQLHSVVKLSTERAAQVLLRLLPHTRESSDLYDLAGMLLDLLFNDGQIQPRPFHYTTHTVPGQSVPVLVYETPPQPARAPAGLDARQRAALHTLLDLPAFWDAEHNLLSLYGLPKSREELRRFLRESS